MNINQIVNTTTRALGKIGLQCRKHAPEALVVAGVVGVVTSTVMACKATTKAGEIANGLREDLETIHKVAEGQVPGNYEYTEEDKRKDTAIVYAKAALQYAKLYGPSVIVGVVSIAGIVASHNILRKRNLALAAAYATVDRSFKDYRNHVIERFGKEIDKELKYNVKAQAFDETVVNEDGTETQTTKTVAVVDGSKVEISEFARFYDDGCKGWTKDPEVNLRFLKMQEKYANDRLKSRGYLFLNEVYESLGIQASQAGQIVGWIYDEKCPNGDNFVDFGIYDTNKAANRRFVNGYERTILLDFNVDGNILNLM